MWVSDKRTFRVFGVKVLDVPMTEAIRLLTRDIEQFDGRARSIFFVNAHTLNVAATDPEFRSVLTSADYVFGDGTGVRWAVRLLHGERLRDNVNGTDLIPAFFEATAGRGYRYYMLGATPEAIERASTKALELFPGWELAGYHHGYVDETSSRKVIAEINAAKPEVLLVGMGNPLQERWILKHRFDLQVPLCFGIGGLFTYWSGDLVRAPVWVRKLGYEWLHLLLLQPHKFQRYVFGNPLFLARVAKSRISGTPGERV